MIVYFIASRKNIKGQIEHLRRFIKIIHDQGHSLALDWVEPIYANVAKKEEEDIDWPIIYKDSMEAITRADVLIAEISVQSFGVGYHVAMAIQQKKPTLLLHRDDIDDSLFASGIPTGQSDSAIMKSYNDKTVEKIVADFLDKNDIKVKDMRFNFFADRTVYNYLRWASFKTGKTKAQILRELVHNEVEKQK